MKTAKITLLLFFVLFNIGFKPGEQIPPREIPMKDFFRNPAKSAFRISPDGKYFSYRADYKGKLNVFVQPVNSDKAVRVTNDTTRSIFNYFWKGNHILYLQDIGGDENFQLFSVNADGTELKPLTPFPGYRTEVINILKFVPGMEKKILIGLNKRDKQYFDPYIIDIETGKMDLKYQNKENFDTWYTDNDGVIRIATKTDGVNVTYLYRSNEKESFKELVKTSFKDAFYPQYFDKANKNFLVLSNLKGDKVALTEYDPLVKKEVKMLYQNPEFDLSTVNFDQKERKLISVEWSSEKHDLHFFDDKWKEIQQSLENKQKGYEVRIVDYDDNKNKAIVWSGNDKLPAKYFIYDFRTKDFKEAANAYPWFKGR
jgi:Tol biopolymer transport system component